MRKNRMTAFASALLMGAVLMTACGKKEEPRPPTEAELRAERLAKSEDNQKLQSLLEQQRSTAIDNIKVNVASYFAANPRFQPASEWNIIAHTDDYISPSCPQGSGWGWVNIMRVKGKEVEKKKVFCSTSSASLGCYIEDDFRSGPNNAEASRCNDSLPHPLKPIGR